MSTTEGISPYRLWRWREEDPMSREECERLPAQIHAARAQTLDELADVAEAEFGLATTMRPWKWDTLLRLLLPFGNHMREHATHIEGARSILRSPLPVEEDLARRSSRLRRGSIGDRSRTRCSPRTC